MNKAYTNIVFIIAIFLFVLGCGASGGRGQAEVKLFLGYQGGYGGYTYPVYEPHVLFRNGVIAKNPKVALNELNPTKQDKDQAVRWGKWKRSGGEILVTWSNGKTTKVKEKEVYNAIAASRNEKIDGSFQSMSGGGNIAFGGSFGVASVKNISFDASGRFSFSSLGTASSPDFTTSSRDNQSGTYSLNGYNLTLKFNNGETRDLFFCFFPGERRGGKSVVYISGNTYNKRDSNSNTRRRR